MTSAWVHAVELSNFARRCCGALLLCLGLVPMLCSAVPPSDAPLTKASLTVPAAPAPAQRASQRLASEPALQLPGADRRPLLLALTELSLAEQAQLGQLADPPALGVPRPLALWRSLREQPALVQPWLRTGWQVLPAGGQVRYLQVQAEGAVSLRLALAMHQLPDALQLSVALADGTVLAQYTGRELRALAAAPDGGPAAAPWYWTPPVPGEVLLLELHLPPGLAPESVDLRPVQLSHQALPTPAPATGSQGSAQRALGDSGTCQLDAVCDPAWNEVRSSVARMYYEQDGFGYTCTGTLLNTTAGPSSSYFLTAHHCLSTQAAAATLVTDWLFEATACDTRTLRPDAVRLNAGAELLSTSARTDSTLLRLRESAPAGVWYSGWAVRPVQQGATHTAIHHPKGDLKKISYAVALDFADCTHDTPKSFNCVYRNPDEVEANFAVFSFNSGMVECGSSGSGMFSDQGQYLVGTLLGGNCSCDNPSGQAFYGRFDRAYANGEWAQWLDPVQPAPDDRDGDGIEDALDPYPDDPQNMPVEREQAAWRLGEIYLATLGRAMDAEGLRYWENALQRGGEWSLLTVAQSFFDQAEVRALYPDTQPPAEFVIALYANVLGRGPDAAGYEYWLTQLETGAISRAQMVLALLGGAWANPEAMANGDVARLRQRTRVALGFASYQESNGLRYSELAADHQVLLREQGARLLADVGTDVAAADAAIAGIAGRLAPIVRRYALDTGRSDGGALYCEEEGGSIEWLNAFAQRPDAPVIDRISVAFGANGASHSAAIEGLPVSLLLYDDPGADGDPSDARLLAAVSATVQSAGNETFAEYPITPTALDGAFFVGVRFDAADLPADSAALPDGMVPYLARYDTGREGARSWARCKGGAFFSNADTLAADPAGPAGFMLRAHAQ